MRPQGGLKTWGHLCDPASTELCVGLLPLFKGYTVSHCTGYTLIRLTSPLSSFLSFAITVGPYVVNTPVCTSLCSHLHILRGELPKLEFLGRTVQAQKSFHRYR